MQPKFNLNNKNNPIQRNQDQKRRSRHKLIGSIVLLFTALLALLNVTSNVKSIPINPQVVEVRSTNESSPATHTTNTISAESHNQPLNSSAPVASSPTGISNVVASQPASNGFKAGVIAKTTKAGDIKTMQPTTTTINTAVVKTVTNNSSTPKISTPKPVATIAPTPTTTTKPKINPAAILDDVSDAGHDIVSDIEKKKANSTTGKAYIQFAALSSEDKANQLKQDLASHGITASVQTIQTSKGSLYRLRAGPYNRDVAQTKLQQITADGYSGIVTGN